MVKLVVFFKRKSGLDVETFQTYWRTRHPEVVLQLPGIRRYVQSHTIRSGYRQSEPVYDGVAELWFDDTQAMREAAASPAYADVQADEAHFIAADSMGAIITREHVLKDGPISPRGVKNIEFVTRKPGMDIEAFQHYWKTIHGPLGAAIPVIQRYVQSHTRLAIYQAGRTPAYDGVAITWFDDTQAMRTSASLPKYERLRADEPNFINPAKLSFIITTEHVIMGGR